MTPAQRINFDRLLNPAQIAFIGGADAAIALTEAKRRGFKGDIWPVNPKRTQLAGVDCYASVEALPDVPDAVFLAIPADPAIVVIMQLQQLGVGGVVCFTAGFRETGGLGDAREQALLDAVGDMALVGPNCYGVINYLDNAALWPFAHGGYCPGYGAAVITQSGMFSSDITMSQRSLPLTHMISAGNQSVLALEDYVDALCENTAVRAIGLHIEGLRDVADFERAALKSLCAGTPIVALKTGKSAIGSALTQSHTGSLSGASELYEALFERCGVISVDSPPQFVETLKFLCVVGAPKGNKVIGFTCSGGGATMLADHSEQIGLKYPAFGENDTLALAELLPDIATVSNPLDYTTPIWGQPEKTEPVFSQAIAASNADTALLVQDYPAPGLDSSKPDYLADGMAFGRAAIAAGVPAAICSTLPENMDRDTRRELIKAGIAPMQGIHEALNAIAHAQYWATARAGIIAVNPVPLIAAKPCENLQMLHEADSKQMLQNSGLTLPKGTLSNANDAGSIAQALGFPVALKMMSTGLAHKTEAGAVALGLNSAAEVQDAVTKMIASVTSYDPTVATDVFLIERLAKAPVAEMIVGIRQDPQFGLAMMIGSGGILVEMLEDTQTLLLPTTATDIKRAISGLKLAELLGGYRGKAAVDLDLLAQNLSGLADFALGNANTIAEI